MEFGKIIKEFTSKKGNRVIFRYPKEEDVAAMLDFINNLIAEDTYIRTHSELKTVTEEQEYLDSIISDMDKNKKIHLVVEVNNTYSGNAEIRRGDHRQEHVGELGIALSPDIRNEGVGSELLKTLILSGAAWKLSLLTLHVFENNHRALHLYQKLGFRRAGMVPKAILFKGSYIGEIKMYLPL